MQRRDNYAIQTQAARQRFLTYDQETMIRKFRLDHDETYLYITMLALPYRIHRTTGNLQRQERGNWVDAMTHGEVLTLYDLLCDAREDRCLSGRFMATQNFGSMFHRSLAEEPRDPLAEVFDRDPERFRRACLALGGVELPFGDLAYRVELFDGLPMAIHFWHSDEEFPAQLRFFWDANALRYIRYETMYYAVGLLRKRLEQA